MHPQAPIILRIRYDLLSLSVVFTKYRPIVDETRSSEWRARGKNINETL